MSSYITRMERAFQIAYGHEKLTTETRDAFLYSQLQAGLKLSLMESPVVYRSLSYKQLCVAAKQEEQPIAELRRCRQYHEKNGEKSQLKGIQEHSRGFIMSVFACMCASMKRLSLLTEHSYQ